MVAAKRRSQLSVDGLEVGAYQYTTHGESVGNTLGNGDDIGLDAQPLVGKELTRTTVSALYLVAYQRSTIALAGVCQILCKLRSGHLDAAHALDAFQDDGCHTTARQFAHPWLYIVQRQEAHMVVVVQRSHNLRVVGHLDSQRRTAMERLLARQDACGLRILERCQLQRILVGLGTAVNQEQLVVLITANLTQTLGQLLLQLVNHRVAVESYLLQLLRHLLDVVRMRVAYADHGMTAIEVQIFLSLVIPNLTALALHDVHVEEWIYVE